MESSSEPGNDARPGEVTSAVVLVSRMMWMMLGPMLLLVTTYAIVTSGSWFTAWDAAFCGVVALMIAGRWVEQQSGSAVTATGEPATVQTLQTLRSSPAAADYGEYGSPPTCWENSFSLELGGRVNSEATVHLCGDRHH